MSRAAAWRTRLIDWAVRTEGSSRSSALIRIGLALLLWGRWAGEVALFRYPSVSGLLLSGAFFTTTTAMLFGLFSRAATAAAGVVAFTMYYYVGFGLGREPWTHHHVYLLAMATLLCALTPCGRSYSVDRWLAVRRASRAGRPPSPERGNLWGLRLIALQLSMVYLWSAFDKTTPGFLGGDRLEMIVMWFYLGSDYPTWSGFPALMAVASVAAVALEYALGIGLLFSRTRKWLVIPGLLWHGIIFVTLSVATFSLTMWCLYLAYFDADAVHGVIDELGGPWPRADAT